MIEELTRSIREIDERDLSRRELSDYAYYAESLEHFQRQLGNLQETIVEDI